MNQLLHQIALKLIPGIGDVLMKNLISYCGGVEEVFKAKKGKLLRVPGIGEVLATSIVSFKDFDRAELELAFIEKHQIQTFFYLDENYPYRLRDLPDSPCLLFGIGTLDLNPSRQIGVVGTRKASEYGREFTQQFIADIKPFQVQVVSGLAQGIDGIAHKACIENDIPTIGVLAHGLDRIYPYQHQSLAKKMLVNGGLLTEFLSNTNPDRENFPKRNRIVAGLSDVLIVPETAIKGGARITAEIAHSYNRDIMAVPGRINDYYSQGCNYLIQENKAALLNSCNDLILAMNWEQKAKTKPTLNLFNQLTITEQELIVYIRSKVKVHLDTMAFELNKDPGSLALQLLELEFNGFVRSLPGKMLELK
ncbi:MAG: DNA-protecting protein DprA [Bacteroidetes bacterium B1(2017)]|nr:MAG: DNA-protecting protein DprA [Bacteroidetes bacterium B1(2017)]